MYIQADSLNLDSSSGYGKNNERESIVQKKCTFGEGDKHYSIK